MEVLLVWFLRSGTRQVVVLKKKKKKKQKQKQKHAPAGRLVQKECDRAVRAAVAAQGWTDPSSCKI